MALRTQENYFYGASTQTDDDLWRANHNGEDPAAVAERQGPAVADAEKYVSTYRRRAGYADYLRETI